MTRNPVQTLADRTRTMWGRIASWLALRAIWLSTVVAAGIHFWWTHHAAAGHADTTGLVIRCLLVGLVGLIVLTKVEMHAEPWRFDGRR